MLYQRKILTAILILSCVRFINCGLSRVVNDKRSKHFYFDEDEDWLLPATEGYDPLFDKLYDYDDYMRFKNEFQQFRDTWKDFDDKQKYHGKNDGFKTILPPLGPVKNPIMFGGQITHKNVNVSYVAGGGHFKDETSSGFYTHNWKCQVAACESVKNLDLYFYKCAKRTCDEKSHLITLWIKAATEN